MTLAVVANLAVDCNAYLSSDALDCLPWGPLIDVGHAVACLAACAVCIGLVRAPSIPLAGKAGAVFGALAMAATAALHVASVLGALPHTTLFQPLVALWALAGIWIGGQSIARRPFDIVSLVGLALAVTAVWWWQSLSSAPGAHRPSDDAMRLAGSGFFALAYPLWIALVADLGPHPRRAFRYAAHPIAANAQRLAILGGSTVATVVFIIPFWYFATFRPILGDPSWPVHVTNGSQAPLIVSLTPGSRSVYLQPGTTSDLDMGFEPIDLSIVATDVQGNPRYCRSMSARDVLHARLQVTLTSSPGSCASR